MDKVVLIDFSGTLIKPDVAEEANLKIYDLLRIPRPSKEKHKKQHATKSHYQVLRDKIEVIYGIRQDMTIEAVQNYGDDYTLNGNDVLTCIMTDLFRNAMYEVASEWQKNIFVDGLLPVLLSLKSRGYKLAIFSGVRKDIISGILAITQCPLEFDYISGQDPALSKEDNDLLAEEVLGIGEIHYLIGDKMSDITSAKKVGAKSIFVSWGHPIGGEDEVADFVVNSPKELESIIE